MKVQINAVLKGGHQQVVALVEAKDLFHWDLNSAQIPANVEKVIVVILSEKNEKILAKYKSSWYDAIQFGVGL